jgi:hypothetical protein
MNKYSFTGSGNILIRAAVAAKYGSRSFVVGEPIAYFTDVTIEVVFSNSDKIANQGISNLVSDSKAEPSILRVESVKTTESLQSLLYKKQTNNTKNKTEVKKIASSGGILYLPISSEDVLSTSLFIYDINQNKIETYTIGADNTILGLTNGTYTVFYSISKVSNSTFFLESPSLPIMALEVSVKGNLNGKTGEVVLHFNNTKLLSRPTFDFNAENPFVESLEFVIQKDKDLVEVNYYG